MIRRIDLRAQILSPRELSERLPRAALDVEAATAAVAPIVDDVRERGGAALRDLAERFDGVRPERLRVPASALEEAAGSLDSELREAFELSIAHNRAGHRAQMPAGQETRIVPGGVVRQRWIPVRRVGLYVPGGLAAYPSSVFMNAVAAQVAGVEAIALASPPRKDAGGLVHPTVLAVCRMLGIEEVYAVGGAQAVAMFAYGAAGEPGTPDPLRLCEPVDVVTGPGNVYVAAAKRAVRGVVGIDAEAGPTEIAIIADADAEVELVRERTRRALEGVGAPASVDDVVVQTLVTAFRDLRGGVSQEGWAVERPSTVLSTAEAVAVSESIALAGAFFPHARDGLRLVPGQLLGAVRKDDPQDGARLLAYWDAVVRRRAEQGSPSWVQLWQQRHVLET